MNKTTIYFVRHGQVDNPDQLLYGRLPGFPLSKDGINEVKKMAKYFKKQQVKFLYSSPMLRTKQTAKIISEVIEVKPRISNLLNEVNIIFQGISLDDYKESYQPYIYEKKYIKKGQESIETIYKRMLRFVRLVSARHTSEKIIAVSHGDPIVILKAKTTNHDFTFKYKKENYIEPGTCLRLSVGSNYYIWSKSS